MEKQATVSTRLWNLRYVVLVWMVLLTVGSVVWNHFHPPLYTSEVHLFIEEKQPEREHLSGQFKYHTPNVRKVYHLATSTKVLEHLIKKFKLAKHFGIRDSDRLGKERVRERLAKNIDVRMLDPNSIAVMVRGRDRGLVARMANEIHLELVRITEKQAMDELTRTVRLYDRVLNGLEKGSRLQERRLVRVLDSLRTSLATAQYDSHVDILLSSLIGDLAANERDLANARKTHQMASMLMRKEHVSSILLLKGATFDVHTVPLRESLFRVFATVMIGTLLGLVLLGFWFRYQGEFLTNLQHLDEIPSQASLAFLARGVNDRSIDVGNERPVLMEQDMR